MADGHGTRTGGARPSSADPRGDPSAALPVPSDARLVGERFGAEERQLVAEIATLEARLRHFADVERPAYASWRRLEFGPLLVGLEELSDELRMRRVLADRVEELALRAGLHRREALHVLTRPEAGAARVPGGGFDPDEVAARRRAKRDRKREERKATKRMERAAERPGPVAGETSTTRPERVVRLYRSLARRLHPDSPHALRAVAPERLGAVWSDVQEAYEGGRLERLLALAAWIESLGEPGADPRSPTAPGGAEGRPLLSLGERADRLRALRRSHRALERELAALRADPAWEFDDRLRIAPHELARRTRAAIESEIERVRRALQEVDAFFAAIGRPRPPRPRPRRS